MTNNNTQELSNLFTKLNLRIKDFNSKYKLCFNLEKDNNSGLYEDFKTPFDLCKEYKIPKNNKETGKYIKTKGSRANIIIIRYFVAYTYLTKMKLYNITGNQLKEQGTPIISKKNVSEITDSMTIKGRVYNIILSTLAKEIIKICLQIFNSKVNIGQTRFRKTKEPCEIIINEKLPKNFEDIKSKIFFLINDHHEILKLIQSNEIYKTENMKKLGIKDTNIYSLKKAKDINNYIRDLVTINIELQKNNNKVEENINTYLPAGIIIDKLNTNISEDKIKSGGGTGKIKKKNLTKKAPKKNLTKKASKKKSLKKKSSIKGSTKKRKTIIKNGKQYVVRTGKMGGEYIVKNNKKVYV